MEIFSAKSPIHIDGTDVMEMPVNDDENNNSKDERGYTHGTRTCIKRKKNTYGKFFDFCAEKCVYN